MKTAQVLSLAQVLTVCLQDVKTAQVLSLAQVLTVCLQDVKTAQVLSLARLDCLSTRIEVSMFSA